MKSKKLGLGIALLLTVVFTACAQTSLSGRYVADDEDSIYSYFEFTNRNTVRIGVEFAGILSSSVTARYEIKNGYVIINNNDGEVIELEIIDANTLEGEGFLLDGVRFIKRSS
jgi:hypothetical protein